MTIATGDKIPNANLLRIGANGPEVVELETLTAGKKVAIFGLPGAYTGTCTTAHVPSFMRTFEQFKAKGVDHVICLTVNDPFVVAAWSDSTGAGQAGLTMLADADGAFTKEIGMDFSAPPAGFYDRSKRYSMFVEDGVVTIFNPEVERGACEISAGETLLDQIA